MKKFLLPLAFVAAATLAACGDDDVAVVEDPAEAPAGAPMDTAPPAATVPPAQTEGPVVIEE